METITISVNKVAIGIALAVGLVIGGVIGMGIGGHHGRHESRQNFRGGYNQPMMMMRGANPMMNKDAAEKMMMNGPNAGKIQATTTVTTPEVTK